MAFLKKKERSFPTTKVLLAAGAAAGAYYAAKRVPWKKVLDSEFVADWRERVSDGIDKVTEAIVHGAEMGASAAQEKGKKYLDNISATH